MGNSLKATLYLVPTKDIRNVDISRILRGDIVKLKNHDLYIYDGVDYIELRDIYGMEALPASFTVDEFPIDYWEDILTVKLNDNILETVASQKAFSRQLINVPITQGIFDIISHALNVKNNTMNIQLNDKSRTRLLVEVPKSYKCKVGDILTLTKVNAWRILHIGPADEGNVDVIPDHHVFNEFTKR